MTKERNEEKFLIKIPFFGYFFKKIRENKKVIEKTLDRGEETKGSIIKKSFFGGLIKIVLNKTFKVLKKKKNGKEEK